MNPTRLAAVAAAMLCALGGVSTGVVHADPPTPTPPPAPAPGPAPKTSIDGDGTFAVGTDIAPGTYASAGPVGNGACYWKRTSGDKVVDNAMTKKSQVVRIEPGDTSFTTNDCQSWQLTDASPPPAAAPGDLLGQLGMFIGQGILAGPR